MNTPATPPESLREPVQQSHSQVRNYWELIEWRRDKVLELSSKGYSQTEIAKELKTSKSTISRDMDHIREEFYRKKREFQELMYFEYIGSLYALNRTLKKLWDIVDGASSSRKEQMQAIALLNDTYLTKARFMDSKSLADEIIDESRQKSQGGDNIASQK